MYEFPSRPRVRVVSPTTDKRMGSCTSDGGGGGKNNNSNLLNYTIKHGFNQHKSAYHFNRRIMHE